MMKLPLYKMCLLISIYMDREKKNVLLRRSV